MRRQFWKLCAAHALRPTVRSPPSVAERHFDDDLFDKKNHADLTNESVRVLQFGCHVCRFRVIEDVLTISDLVHAHKTDAENEKTGSVPDTARLDGKDIGNKIDHHHHFLTRNLLARMLQLNASLGHCRAQKKNRLSWSQCAKNWLHIHCQCCGTLLETRCSQTSHANHGAEWNGTQLRASITTWFIARCRMHHAHGSRRVFFSQKQGGVDAENAGKERKHLMDNGHQWTND